MIFGEEHTEAILAPFFGHNITSIICSNYPMTVFGMIKSACEGKYPLTYIKRIRSSRNKITGTIRVICEDTGHLLYIILRRK